MKTFQNEEAYICIYSKRDHDAILFTHEGGIDIGNVEEKAKTLILPVAGEGLNSDSIKATLLTGLDSSKHERVSKFIMALYEVYKRQYFTYMEINPLVITDKSIFILDFAAKVMFKIFRLYFNFTEYFEREFLVYSFIYLFWNYSWIQLQITFSKQKEPVWHTHHLLEGMLQRKRLKLWKWIQKLEHH